MSGQFKAGIRRQYTEAAGAPQLPLDRGKPPLARLLALC
jgi:hypothetical protein